MKIVTNFPDFRDSIGLIAGEDLKSGACYIHLDGKIYQNPEVKTAGCYICGHRTSEFVKIDKKFYCPSCHQDLQEIGVFPLTRHANVHHCSLCGELVRDYGFKFGENWVCMSCVVSE